MIVKESSLIKCPTNRTSGLSRPGIKIPSPYKVAYAGALRRVYYRVHPVFGAYTYIVVRGMPVLVNIELNK